MYIRCCIIVLLIMLISPVHAVLQHAISYEGGCRFGDRILGYSQARYLSYFTGLPFLYRPFIYSECLTIDYQAQSYEMHAKDYENVFYINSNQTLQEFFCKIQDPNTLPTLFILDYFPAELGEWDLDPTRSVAFDIPWKDPRFNKYLQRSLSPRIVIPDFRQPGRLNVATHVRVFSGADTPQTPFYGFPLKNPTSDYHKRQIKRVFEWNLSRPMHVFLFSDIAQPLNLLEEFRQAFRDYDITFDIQVLERPDVNNVVQDFFAMQKFDVLIATQSNFSMMAARLGSFDMIIYPVHAQGRYPQPSRIDRVQLVTTASTWFPYKINTILKDN
jgi:hypothetical protein